MQLQVGGRLADESGEYEVIGRPYTTNMGKDAPDSSSGREKPLDEDGGVIRVLFWKEVATLHRFHRCSERAMRRWRPDV
jgi:hypothetical protein